jgi:epoxyqueuosine reductase
MAGQESQDSSPGDGGLRDWLKAQALEAGFDAAGVTALRASDHAAFYEGWLADGLHGDMAYLARPDAVARRLDPRRAVPELKSALVVAHDYGSGEEQSDDPARGIIARYARGRDYHKVIRKRLLSVLAGLEAHVGRELPLARACVDTAPVLERELARRAGLGWFGRNTMILHPRRGSYFFLGVLLLELDLAEDEPFAADRCGTCDACVDACPTGALLGRDANGAPVMDARRCISYLTIEHRGPIPVELRPLIGNRVFGCDICQECCPYTRKFSRPSSEPTFASRGPADPPFGVQPEAGASRPHPGTRSPSLIALLETALDEVAWDSFSRGSAIRRSGRAGFARNVCVGLGNWGSPAAVPVLSRALSDLEPLVRAHAAWALGMIATPQSLERLQESREAEADPLVLTEMDVALGRGRQGVSSRGGQGAPRQ